MQALWWATVSEADPALKQHWFNVSCLLRIIPKLAQFWSSDADVGSVP